MSRKKKNRASLIDAMAPARKLTKENLYAKTLENREDHKKDREDLAHSDHR